MKNSKIAKPATPLLMDVRDYLSSSMFLKKVQHAQVETVKDMPVTKTEENSKSNSCFDLFAHILEG